jgi:hypothetical protein
VLRERGAAGSLKYCSSLLSIRGGGSTLALPIMGTFVSFAYFLGGHFDRSERKMIQATLTEPATGVGEPSVSGVSWAAVSAGAVASLALTLVLLSLGTGLGLAVVSPWGNSGVSTTTFKIGTGLYFIVMAMFSSAIGGYLAGRLRTKWVGVHTDEVYFRDPSSIRSPR